MYKWINLLILFFNYLMWNYGCPKNRIIIVILHPSTNSFKTSYEVTSVDTLTEFLSTMPPSEQAIGFKRPFNNSLYHTTTQCHGSQWCINYW